MKDYVIKGNVVEATLENGKVVKISKKWVDDTTIRLDTDIEDVVLMYLEDNGFLDNEEQDELDTKAKTNKVSVEAKANVERKKVVRERKPNVAKENIISDLAHYLLQNSDYSLINVENKAKIITFTYQNKEFKLDLVEKRVKKEEK